MFDLLNYLTLAFLPGFLLLALVYGARRYETPPWWRTRMLAATVAAVAGSMAIAALWSTLLGDRHLLDNAALGTWPGAMLGILSYEFLHYWYHRLAHRYDRLWLAGHQMHHSAEAMDAFSANYLHPVDLFVFTSIGSLVFFPLLGLTREAGALGAAWIGFHTMFQHANISTPRWLGYLIQRPESHVVHHQRGSHRYNYANLPLWDIAFATFRNPRSVDGVAAGFYTGASTRVGEMLRCRDVSRPPRGEAATVATGAVPAAAAGAGGARDEVQEVA